MSNVTAKFTVNPRKAIETEFRINILSLDHNKLYNRDLENQHPISAITGLEGALSALQENIGAEVTERTNADIELNNKIDNVESDIQAEATSREQADIRLEGLISAEESRAESAESGLNTAISNETSARTQADTTLQNNITAEENRAKGIENGLRSDLTAETTARQNADTGLQNQITTNANDIDNIEDKIPAEASSSNQLADKSYVDTADNNLQSQIDAISASSDVTDIVGTYAELQAYDTSTLTNDDIIKVLQDESQGSATTYYRWIVSGSSGSFVLIGSEGPYYTKSEANELFDEKQDEITATNKLISDLVDDNGQTNKFVTSAEKTQISTNASNITALQSGKADKATTLSGYGIIDAYTKTEVDTALNGKQNTISDLATIRSDASSGASAYATIQNYGDIVTHNASEFATSAQGALADSAVQPSDLATVATTGSYNDLINKPTIPAAQVNSDWNATSGVAEILNKPTIPTVPTNVSAFTNDAGYITSAALTGYATENYVDTGLSGKQATLVSGTNIKTVNNQSLLGSGDITIGGAVDSVNGQTGAVVLTASDVGALPDSTVIPTEATVSGWGFTKNVGTVTSVNNVAPVNGNVSLSIPTVNNSTISFTQGGVSKGSFTLNQPTGTTIALDAGRNVGEIIEAALPLTDAGLHLLDGSLILGGGIYDEFVQYIAGLVSTYPDCFTTEAAWQQSVTDYGVCGKFVYDSVNNTVRLPKYSDKIYTTDTASTAPVVGNGMNLGIYDGATNGGFFFDSGNNATSRASFYGQPVGTASGTGGLSTKSIGVTTDGEKSGLIASLSNIIAPVEGYYYIVVATATKTEIEVDIDEIVTDLNGKADKDLSNTTASRSFFSGYAFSVEQASVTANNYYTLNLPETITPQNYYVKAYAVFTSAGGGYSVGDVVPFECLWGMNYRSLTFWYNSTQVGFVTSDQVTCCQKGTSNTGVTVQNYIKVVFDFYKLR